MTLSRANEMSTRKRSRSDDDGDNNRVKKKRKITQTKDDIYSDLFIRKIVPGYGACSSSAGSILDHIHSLHDSPACKMDELCKSVDGLRSLANAQIDKIKEMYYRKHAVNQFLLRVKDNAHYSFLKDIVMEFRNFEEREWTVKHECGLNHWTRYSVEIALKCPTPTEEYVLFMSSYLKEYVDEIEGICSIICEYSHNGYIWYNLSYNEQSDDDPEEYNSYWIDSEYNPAMMYKLRPHPEDFEDNAHYHSLPSEGDAITFDSLRNDLCSGSLNAMTDEEVADLIATICWHIFDELHGETYLQIVDYIEWLHGQENKGNAEKRAYFTDCDFER